MLSLLPPSWAKTLGHVARFERDESGATAIEYALIGGLLSIMVIAGATQIGGAVRGFFQAVAAGFP